KCHVGHGSVMLQWRRDGLAGQRVPNPRGAIVAGRGNQVVLGAEGGPAHRTHVTERRRLWLTANRTPDSCSIVVAGSDEFSAAGTECRVDDKAAMSQRRRDRLTSSGVPNPRRVVRSRCGDVAAVRTKRCIIHATHMLKLVENGSRIGIPLASRAIAARRQDLLTVLIENGHENGPLMFKRRYTQGAGGYAPEASRAIPTCRHNSGTVRPNGRIPQAGTMDEWFADRFAALDIPQTSRTVLAGCKKESFVGTEGDAN